MPMNFNVIGGIGGGGGGPAGAGGSSGWMRGIGAWAATGGAFSLNLNKLRSAPSGFGRSAFRTSRCTAGGAGAAAAPCGRAAEVGPAARLDVGARSADVPGHILTMTTTSTRTRAPSTSCRLRSVAIGSQAEIRRELHHERQRFVGVALRQRYVVDDDEGRGAFERVNELSKTLVVALPHRVNLEQSKTRILLGLVHLEAPVDELHVALLGKRWQRGVRQTARRREIRRKDLVEERRELLLGARLADDERARRRHLGFRRLQRPRRGGRAVRRTGRFDAERIDPQAVRGEVADHPDQQRNDQRPLLDDDALPERHQRRPPPRTAGLPPDGA